MGRYDDDGRIPRRSFMVVSVTLCLLAVVFAIGRIVIRLHYQQNLAVDDAFLIVAVVFYIVALSLILSNLSALYLLEAVSTQDPSVSIPSSFVDQIVRLEEFIVVSEAFSFSALFAVKFSFLFLFKTLIRNVRKMKVYWWIVFWTTAAVWALTFIEDFISCPTFNSKSLKCSNVSWFPKVVGWSIAIVVEDILTDIMIITIPIILLWRVQIKIQQKFALGLSLCLSIMIIIITIVKISGIYASPFTVDITWLMFWHLTEANIAIIMVSLTAFRSLFITQVSSAHRSPYKQSLPNRLLHSRIALGRKQVAGGDREQTEAFPEIPRATLTGMRTLIWGKRSDGSVMKSERSDHAEVPPPSEGESADQTIRVEHDMWQESKPASSHTESRTENLSDHHFV